MHDHIADIISMIAALKPRPERVLVQVPAGLKQRALELAEALEQNGYSAMLAADDCFGACDLSLAAAEASGADAILHIGHAPFYKPFKSSVPVVYYEWPIDAAVDEAKVRNEIIKIKEKRVGLVASVQYTHILPRIAELLRAVGKSAEIGGHVLGCWAKNAEALADKTDALVFVGSGMFHPFGCSCDYFLDLERCTVSDVRDEIKKWEKVRWARISQAKDARTFAILVSTKPGQSDMARAEAIKTLLEKGIKRLSY